MKRLITLLLIATLIGCEKGPSNHPIFKYYPPDDVFTEGFVSKYYFHYYPDNPDAFPGTEIRYTKYVKLDDTHFQIETYNAGYELMSFRDFRVAGDTLFIDGGFGLNSSDVTDTTALDLSSNVHSVWEGGSSDELYQVNYEWDEKKYLYTEYQQAVEDTTILDKPAKLFRTAWDYREAASDSIISEGASRSYYVQGMGFYGSDIKGPTYRRQMELIEQMSLKEFEKRADHGEHRVAWIDPNQTISDDADFKICGHEFHIADYYNSTPDGRYIHSKRAMLDTIHSNLDKAKLFDQSGRLVFRFVVNCEGKAGRFIANGYDLNYQPMEFRKETVDHLFGILRKLEDWRVVKLDDGVRDAYFYITFNIENGEIIDILP